VAEGSWPGVPHASTTGAVTFAAQPTLAGLDAAAAHGVVLVVNLRTPEEMDRLEFDEAAELRDRGIRLVQIPMTADSLTRADVTDFAHALHAARGPVLVHCASSNRAGAMWAAYLVLERGYPVDEAIAHGQAAGMRSPQLQAHVQTLVDDAR
jgi:uncharacterized protein (TIGR01244 family)